MSYVFSHDEYTRLLEGMSEYRFRSSSTSHHVVDRDWTKDETEYLFQLVRDYDSRWYIIHDRYEWTDGPERSMEVSFVLIHPSNSPSSDSL